jgi:hypothetical protein
VSAVNVKVHEGQRVHLATFHVQSVDDNVHCEMVFEISQDLFDVLVEYSKLGNPDLVLLLFHENDSFRWSLLSESWLKRYSNLTGLNQYVV